MANGYPIDDRGYTDTRGASDYTGLSPSYLAKARHFGDGPEFVKFGKAVRYSYAALDAHAARQARTRGRRSSPARSRARWREMTAPTSRGDPPKKQKRPGKEAQALLSFGGDTSQLASSGRKGNQRDGAGRGWVEIVPSAEPGRIWVHDWSEHYDSGAILAEFAETDRAAAVRFALAYSAETGRKVGAGVAP